MTSSIELNKKPFNIRYRAFRMVPLLCTMCWSGKILDRSIWSMRSILGGSCLLNKIGPAVVSQDSRRIISLVVGPLPIIYRVGEDHRQIERSCYICGPKYPWLAIDSEMNSFRIGLSPEGHRVVELDDHPRVEKPKWDHKWLKGVPLH